MKTIINHLKVNTILCFLLLGVAINGFAQNDNSIKEIKGLIIDDSNGKKLALASIQIKDTNIGTVSNTEGEFALKIPNEYINSSLEVSLLGYESTKIDIINLNKSINEIRIKPSSIDLEEIEITSFSSAKDLIEAVFKRKQENYSNERTIMTTFYRETIKKRNRNVSLSEAVVNLYKQPYSKSKSDFMKLLKSRKSTDYKKLDTVALKLQGGPYNALYIDLMKYPEYIFTLSALDDYDFSFDKPTEINDIGVYTVNFKQKESVKDPLYYGKLYISSSTLALVRGEYSLNVSNKYEASKLFIKRKPSAVSVEPAVIKYRVDYTNKGNKWYYNYANATLTFKVRKKRKLFNSTFSLSCEMAVTDWKTGISDENWNREGNTKKNIILADEASGFSDPEFWGDFNVIEPEKSIESAIKKIQKKLDKISKSSPNSAFGAKP